MRVATAAFPASAGLAASQDGNTLSGSVVSVGETTTIHWNRIKAIHPPPVPPAKYKGSIAFGGLKYDYFHKAAVCEPRPRNAGGRVPRS